MILKTSTESEKNIILPGYHKQATLPYRYKPMPTLREVEMLVLFPLTKVYEILHRQLSVPQNQLFFFQELLLLRLQGVDDRVPENVAQQQLPASKLQGH